MKWQRRRRNADVPDTYFSLTSTQKQTNKKYAKEKETFFEQSHCQRLKGSTNLTEMGEEQHGEMAILGGEGKSPSTSWRANEQAL